MTEWKIQSRAHACQACGKTFADKEPFHTVLLEEKQEYQRLDICAGCWESQYKEGANDRKGFISQWHGIFQAPPAAAPEPILKESAESLLRKLIETNDPKYGPVCYILAVMLERKRTLRVRQQIQREGSRIFIYEHPKTGDVFTITDPNLQLNQLEEVQRDTANLLAHGLNPPPTETSAPSAPVSESAESTEPAQPPVESVSANNAE
ncbi:MAG TPA: hypothetical protein VGO67_16265 [Verrucomicrobiae bacterium]|jgi:hypothetical protein